MGNKVVSAPNALTIKFVNGDIINTQADVCVTSVHRSKDMTKGPLASHIVRHAGYQVQCELNEINHYDDLDHGQVVKLSPWKLASKFKQLMAVCLYRWIPGNDLVLMAAVTECLDLAAEMGFESIALPALGMGGQDYPPFNVAMAITAAIVSFRANNEDSTLRTVYIALKDKDENSVRTFLQTSTAFISGELFRDDLEDKGGSTVLIDGMEDFSGLERTKPGSCNHPNADTVPSSSPKTTSNQSPTQLMANLGLSSLINLSGEKGIFRYRVSPNVSLQQKTFGVRIELGVNFEKYVPRFLDKFF